MLRKAGGSLCLLMAGSVASAQPAADSLASSWSVTYNQEVRYSFWTGDRGSPVSSAGASGSGAQLYSPFGVSVSGKLHEDFKLQLGVYGGSVWSRQSTAGYTGTVATVTDTTMSSTLTYGGFDGWQPYVSLSVNLPTGRSVLKGSAANARMDSDLVDVGSFGGGLTIGPTIGVNVSLTDELMLSFGAGHTVPYKFDVEGSIDPDTLQQGTTEVAPGRNTSFNASLGYQAGAIYLQILGSYSTSSDSYTNNTLSYRAGDQWSVSANGSYNWTPETVTAVSGSWSHGQKNKVYDSNLAMLVYDEDNSNNSYYRARIEHSMTHELWTIGPYASWLRRTVNSYNPTTYQFVQAKTRWGLGAAVKYSVNSRIQLNASIERIWVFEDENPEKPFYGIDAIPALRFDAVAIVIGGTVQF